MKDLCSCDLERWGVQSTKKIKPSLHVETGYEFNVGKVHLGPLVEYALSSGDQHIMVGLHIGYPF